MKQTTISKQHGREKGSFCSRKAWNSSMPWRRYENLRYFRKTEAWSSCCSEICGWFRAHTRVRADEGSMRNVSARRKHRIKRAVAKMLLQSSKRMFEAAGVSGVPRTSRCRILQRLAVMRKPSIRPLNNVHKQKRLQWVQKYLFKVCGVSDWPLSSTVQKEEPCFPYQNHLHAWPCTISCCREYFCIIGCYGHQWRETPGVAPIVPWPQPYWEPLEILKEKIWGWEVVHIQTAALGGFSDILKELQTITHQELQELWRCCHIRGPMLKCNWTC